MVVIDKNRIKRPYLSGMIHYYLTEACPPNSAKATTAIMRAI
jgi:hypothetical protein